MNNKCCFLFFVKYPVAGKVKSRIAATLGEEYACGLYKCFVLDMLDKIAVTPAEIIICFDPYEESEKYQQWLGDDFKYIAQRGKTLGEKMSNSLTDAFGLGFKKAIVIGSDIPDLPVDIIEKSIFALGENDSVLGPCHDGGYYLIGFREKSFVPQAFKSISWSSDKVLDQTLSVLLSQPKGFSTFLLDKWYDIDTPGDIEILLKRNKRNRPANLRTISYILEKVQYHKDEIL